jgi:predicted nucleic acid-binding protein
MQPVANYLKKNGHLISGGTKLKSEYQKNRAFVAFLNALSQRGQVKSLSDVLVDSKADELSQGGKMVSDDPHILAIAALSNARVLVSEDKELAQDFTGRLFFEPKGKVYKDEQHKHLLVRLPKCLVS